MPRTLKLLLTENVDNTGIVGDVVTVRKGYARNFLLPRGLATEPSEEKVQQLAAKRAEAERQLAELRKAREALVARLDGHELTMIRSCNDQGILYGAVTQQELADALIKDGFAGIKPREVRIGGQIKRVDKFEVHVKFAADLEAVVKLIIKADRPLEMDKDEPKEPEAPAEATAGAEGAAPEAGAPESKAGKPAPTKGDKPAKDAKGEGKPAAPEGKASEPKADKPAKAEKADRPEKKDGKAPAKKDGKGEATEAKPSSSGWGKVVDKGPELPPPRRRRER